MDYFLKLLLVNCIVMTALGLVCPGRKRDGRRPSRLGVFAVRALVATCVFGLNVRYAPANVAGLLVPAENRNRLSSAPHARGDKPARSLVASAPTGGMTVVYQELRDPELIRWEAWARDHRMLEQYAEWANGWVHLPERITVTFRECGHANAHYRWQSRRIEMCLEQLAAMRDRLEKRVPPEQLGNAVAGAASFLLTHELGHALVHTLRIPVAGREEDAVDQLAAYVMLDGSDKGRNAVLYWAMSLPSEDDRAMMLADEHSLYGQRQYNVLCLAYGQDPVRNAYFVTSGMLPPKRAQRCPSEYSKIRFSWDRLLSEHRK